VARRTNPLKAKVLPLIGAGNILSPRSFLERGDRKFDKPLLLVDRGKLGGIRGMSERRFRSDFCLL